MRKRIAVKFVSKERGERSKTDSDCMTQCLAVTVSYEQVPSAITTMITF